MLGQCGAQLLEPEDEHSDQQRSQARAAGLTVSEALPQRRKLGDERARAHGGERQSEKILELAREDDDRDAGGEADGDRIGNEFDVGAEPQKADAASRKTPAMTTRAAARRRRGAQR